ncbi:MULTISPECIES: hypothetical protein [Pseudomonas]|uniref:hypothetical protein n=1 Tax=Pseudomonas TaxID=286 RepID=UPI000F6CF397|nr:MULTISPECIES: hypothetical protein [Pseudomonas]AZC56586.1 hypothetical protein C4K34_2421 [Pseudomonas chlororaphis subsp. piscium]AZC88691.1 hypothetical protein C4K29_2390 [Pseudomonas chlororaphis subsp. piscium]MBP5056249.1 hypothetical protein [Pseudomonas chlororaphis]MBP5070559.1 hypothetical protein [Pseudomonas chlororaphis]MBP5089938.1 hypothetical protein [Pseudomonas chlororaphis]
MNIPILGFRQEQGAQDRRHHRDDDRVPEPVVDIPRGTTPSAITPVDHTNHESEFFICARCRQNGATFKPSDKYVMNINFAVACMIVVSFAIALLHT